jgi:hypothetical protein
MFLVFNATKIAYRLSLIAAREKKSLFFCTENSGKNNSAILYYYP